MLVAAAAALVACEGGKASGLGDGFPPRYADRVDEGMKRYPDVGRTGMGDASWDCPIEHTVIADGKKHDHSLSTSMRQPLDGVFELDCEFYPPLPVELVVARVSDAPAYERLVDDTRAVRQVGNEQTETVLTGGERIITVVRFTYPTNPAAGVKFEAHYLDANRRMGVTLGRRLRRAQQGLRRS